MTCIFSRRWRGVVLVLTSLFASLACVTLTGGPAAGSPADGVFGPGPFTIKDMQAGLAELSSYQATLTYSFDGTRDGKAEQWSKTYVMLTTREPAARQLTIETAGNIPAIDPVFMAEAGGATYEVLGQNGCTASVASENSLTDWLEPAGILTSVVGADQAGRETVNDAAAEHYTFDERALGGLGLNKSKGEIWVATDGGYVVKYLLTTRGDAGYFGKGIEGTLTWDYELTDANQPVAIQLPKDCPAGMVNVPQLPDASNVRSVPGMLSYDTSSDVTEAAAFYQKQLPDLGWELAGEPALGDTTALLNLTQGDQNLTVILTADAGVTTVNILLAHLPE